MKKNKKIIIIDEMIDKILNSIKEEVAGPGGHIPDGSGPPPHGKGMGPGKGTMSGMGMREDEEEDEEEEY
jgi:hypothetical protein